MAGPSNTSALAFGGTADPPNYANTELWNGTSWTETTDLNISKERMHSNGTVSSAMGAGGFPPPPSGPTASSQEWAGAGAAVLAWATSGNLNTARTLAGGAGTQTAGIAFGGTKHPDTASAETELYNGATWTEVADLNTARGELKGAGSGTSTATLAFGGVGESAANESWNGSSWTEVGDLNTARRKFGGDGVQTSSIIAGGHDGTTTSTSIAESWNGSAWTEVGDLNTARIANVSAGVSNTASITFGGYNAPADANQATTESWNGSSWTEVSDLNSARENLGSVGTVAGALAFAGSRGPAGPTGFTEDWNGASWSEIADLNTAHSNANQGSGTSSLALAFGGQTPASPGILATTEELSQGKTVKTVDTD